MKKFLLILSVTLVVLFCGAWFFASYMINSNFEKVIKDNNIPLKYDSFKVGGFPFNFNITLSNPEYTFKKDKTKIVAKIDGMCDLKAGLFAEKISLTSEGPVYISGNIGNYKLQLKSQAKKSTEYIINLQSSPLSSSFLSNIMKVSSDQKMIFKIIDYIRVSGEGVTMTNLLNNKRLFNIEIFDLKLSMSKKAPKNYQIIFKEKLKNARFTQDFDYLAKFFIKDCPTLESALNQIDSKVRKYFAIFNMYQRGFINHDIEVKYQGAFEKSGKIDIEKAKIIDALGKASLSGDLGFSFFNGLKFSSNLKSLISFSKKWLDVAENSNKNILQLLPRFSSGASTLEKILSSVGKSSQSTTRYVPKLNELGDIKLTAILKYKKKGQSIFVDAKKIDFDTSKYGAALEGKYLFKNNREKYNFDLSVNNYQNLIDDSLEFVSAIGNSNKAVSLASGGDFKVSKSLGNKIKSFLSSISDNPSNKNNIEISAKKTFEEKYPAVGKYSSKQFGSMWNGFKAELIIGEVSRNIKKFIPKEGSKIAKFLDKNLGDIGNVLSSIAR